MREVHDGSLAAFALFGTKGRADGFEELSNGFGRVVCGKDAPASRAGGPACRPCLSGGESRTGSAELVDDVVLGGGATSWSGSRRSASLHSSLHGLPYPPYAGPVLLSPHRA